MEIFFYKLYRRSPESVKENPVLRKILQPNGNNNLIDRYFEFFASGNIQEGEVISSDSSESVQFGEDEGLNLVSIKHM